LVLSFSFWRFINSGGSAGMSELSSEQAQAWLWLGLLRDILVAKSTVEQAEYLHDCAARYRRLSEATRDVAWEMKVSEAPIADVLPEESRLVLDLFTRSFNRVFKDGHPKVPDGASGATLLTIFASQLGEPLNGGRFDVRAANLEKVEAFGLAARRMARYLDGFPRVKRVEVRKSRGGTRGRLPTVMPPILVFMERHHLKPRQTATSLVECIAHLRGKASPENKMVAAFNDDKEWGPVSEDRSATISKWEKRINQALYDRRHGPKIRRRRAKRRQKA
jgi:hypothetical protein